MKKVLLLSFLLSVLFVSCSSNGKDDGTDTLSFSVWKEDINDQSQWFIFREKGDLAYVRTDINKDPYNYLLSSARYTIDGNNAVIIFASQGVIDNTIWLSGTLRGDTLFLEGENESYKLTQITDYMPSNN